MLDEKSRTQVVDALARLIALVENNEISAEAGTLITHADDIEQRTMLPNNEKVSGLVLVCCGENLGSNFTLEGAFVPQHAYGALVEAILQLWTTSQVNAFEGPIKSMVGEMLTSAAMVEKQLSGSDEH